MPGEKTEKIGEFKTANEAARAYDNYLAKREKNTNSLKRKREEYSQSYSRRHSRSFSSEHRRDKKRSYINDDRRRNDSREYFKNEEKSTYRNDKEEIRYNSYNSKNNVFSNRMATPSETWSITGSQNKPGFMPNSYNHYYNKSNSSKDKNESFTNYNNCYQSFPSKFFSTNIGQDSSHGSHFGHSGLSSAINEVNNNASGYSMNYQSYYNNFNPSLLDSFHNNNFQSSNLPNGSKGQPMKINYPTQIPNNNYNFTSNPNVVDHNLKNDKSNIYSTYSKNGNFTVNPNILPPPPPPPNLPNQNKNMFLSQSLSASGMDNYNFFDKKMEKK